MGQIIQPVCDRCGEKGIPGYPFAQMKLVGRTGRVQVLDLCYGCEALMEAWIEYPKKQAERENSDGTD